MLALHALRSRARVRLWFALPLCLGACSSSPKDTLECDRGWICQDSDCDTLCDDTEGGADRDSDRDGTPDYLDLDSDGDGIRDLEEAGDDDPETPPADRNLDGIADYLDPSYPLGAGRRRDAPSGGASGDAGVASGGNANGGMSDFATGSNGASCPFAVQSGCAGAEAAPCNGLDDDCDGSIDEAMVCSCQRGEVRSCFPGPPGRRGVGGCADGYQVCTGDQFGEWGPCQNYRAPELEICDALDNDCNGCIDELMDCAPPLSCPGPQDPRIPQAQPFLPYTLDATQFYFGPDVLSVTWYVEGSPCDRMFAALDPSATADSGKLSFLLESPTQAQTRVLFTLSGSYQVTLRISTTQGDLWCGFIVHVRAPGLRVELCWDMTGPFGHAKNTAVDLDLHLAKAGFTSSFFTPEDCFAETCRGASSPWPNPGSPLGECSGRIAQNDREYSLLGHCPNPRLDIDNRLGPGSETVYLAENISLDAPAEGDRFRVMVHYNANTAAGSTDEDAGVGPAVETHPLVNVYCEGELRGSFGGVPEQLGDPEEVSLSYPGQMWRVADVVSVGSTCTIGPLATSSGGSGYWVSGYEPSYGD